MTLKFRIGSIPVQVHGFFFLMALFLGMDEHNLARLALWVAIVFVSVLVHELGHALMGKAFGLSPQIDLQGMGGLTSWTEGKELSNGKHIAVSLAGPFAGFLFAGLAYATLLGLHPTHPLADFALKRLLWVNFGWGIFNLLPMLPLDGGHVMRSFFASFLEGRADKIARMISIGVAVAIGLLAARLGQWWVVYLAVLYGAANVQALRQSGRVTIDRTFAPSLENAHKALEQQDGKAAAALLRPALAADLSPELRAHGTKMLAYALLIEREWSELLQLLAANAALIGEEDLERFARTARGFGKVEEASQIDALIRKPALGEFRA